MVFISCSKNDRGELVGTKANKFFADKPHGMVLIPSGSFTMGPSNPNVLLDQNLLDEVRQQLVDLIRAEARALRFGEQRRGVEV